MSHLLSLAVLHAAAPGVLGVVFGRDGEFDNAPPWAGPIYVAQTIAVGGGHMLPGGWIVSVDPRSITPSGFWFPDGGPVVPWSALALDCRAPTVAVRLAALVQRAIEAAALPWEKSDRLSWETAVDLGRSATQAAWTAKRAAFLAKMVIRYAPRIRDLAPQEP